jgi:hypothetical protein
MRFGIEIFDLRSKARYMHCVIAMHAFRPLTVRGGGNGGRGDSSTIRLLSILTRAMSSTAAPEGSMCLVDVALLSLSYCLLHR